MKYLLLTLALTGCAAPGVRMSADERKACEAQTCTVWTPQELQGLVREIFKRGYNAGAKSL